MNELKAVIFDMDGVLIDSESIHYEIERIIFDRLGISVPEEVHSTYMGTAGDFMYADLKSRFALTDSVEELLEADDLFRGEYFSNLAHIAPNDGVIGLLDEIRATGLKLGVATSSPPEVVKILLTRCGIISYFDAIVTTTEAGPSKPAPDVYLLAAEKLNVSPSECVVFEDSPNGLLAAKRAGMFCIVMQPNLALDPLLAKADFRIESFTGFTLTRLRDIAAIQ